MDKHLGEPIAKEQPISLCHSHHVRPVELVQSGGFTQPNQSDAPRLRLGWDRLGFDVELHVELGIGARLDVVFAIRHDHLLVADLDRGRPCRVFFDEPHRARMDNQLGPSCGVMRAKQRRRHRFGCEGRRSSLGNQSTGQHPIGRHALKLAERC